MIVDEVFFHLVPLSLKKIPPRHAYLKKKMNGSLADGLRPLEVRFFSHFLVDVVYVFVLAAS